MEKPQPILSHMPSHIKEKIVNLLHTVHKFSLRQCSKELKSVVDQSPIVYDCLKLSWNVWDRAIAVERSIDSGRGSMRMINRNQEPIDHSAKVNFVSRPNGFVKKNLKDNSEVFVENGDFAGAVVEQFVKAFRNPKLSIQTLYISLDTDENENYNGALIMDKIHESLKGLGHRVAVRKLGIPTDVNAQNVLRVLPYLQPGTLEDMNIGFQSFQLPFPVVNLNEIIGMEHWKRAKKLTIRRFTCALDPEATAHFAEADYLVETFRIEDFKYIISNFLKEDAWTARTIHSPNFNLTAIKEYLVDVLQANNRLREDTYRIRNNFWCDATFSGIYEIEMVIRKLRRRRNPINF